MAKTKISEYSTTNANNTDIQSINIDEGCAPSGINNAIRELMVHLKNFQTGASGDPLTVAGSFVASGSATLNGTSIPSSKTLLVSTDIGSTVQGYDADTTKNDVSNTFTANQIISVTDNTNAALRVTQLGTGSALVVEDETNPDSTPFVIAADGTIISGNTASVNTLNPANGGEGTARFQIAGTNTLGVMSGGIMYSTINTTIAAPYVSLGRSNTATVGGDGVVSSGDLLGGISFHGNDGSAPKGAALVQAFVDGTPGTNDMPGRLVFSTTADGASSPTERMRINSAGNILIGGTAARGTTAGTNHLSLFNGTAPAGTLTNGVTMYSSSGDLNFMDAAGNGYKVGYRNIPAVGTKTGSYTLAVGDVGKYVQVGSGGSITIPDATFAEGDVVSVFNNTSGNITITCSITTAYIAGTDADKASVTLATRGVATILFISGTVCVISGNVS